MSKLIVITGPTASGKTGIAVEWAKRLNGEIISADSRQVYRRMDIGTGKDLSEYGTVPYHLIDICEPGTKYNLHRYLHDFRKAMNSIESRGHKTIVCGGTGLYLETALSGVIMPEVPENIDLRKSLEKKSLNELEEILRTYKILHNATDIDTRKRAIRAIEIQEYYRLNPNEAKSADRNTAKPLDADIYIVDISREERRNRISERLDSRLKAGMIEEVKGLLDEGIPAENLLYYGLEYKWITLHILGELSYKEMHDKLEIEIHKFAKRQMTWFRGMERRGFKLIPITRQNHEEMLERILSE